jgi:phage gpG-like protein
MLGFLVAANEVASLAKTTYILRGGRFFKPGTRTLVSALVDSKRLTSRTGRLRDSIAVDLSPSPKAVYIGTDVIYGAVHELGGRFHRPRPFLQPALEHAARGFPELFRREWERQL